jgi:hypothetical protein
MNFQFPYKPGRDKIDSISRDRKIDVNSTPWRPELYSSRAHLNAATGMDVLVGIQWRPTGRAIIFMPTCMQSCF